MARQLAALTRDRFLTIAPGPNGKDQQPVVSYPTERADNHRCIYDRGPTYGPPIWGRDEGAVVDENPQLSKSLIPLGKTTAVDAKDTTPFWSQKAPERVYDEIGPQHGSPNLTVPPDQPQPQKPQLSPAQADSSSISPTGPAPSNRGQNSGKPKSGDMFDDRGGLRRGPPNLKVPIG
ncbi:hypothetical protein GQ53DRAFT_877880 [Thozetella sp. PMI_491]|nr:hypothetical protein GQ53DRAFT_877880 [Thozetella sp. PMI_491]